MKQFPLVNMVFLQVLWFAVILGAANRWMSPAITWFVLYLCWHLVYGERRKQDIVLVAMAALAGSTVDSLWVQMGWLSFHHAVPHPGLAPLWIAMLWAGLALTLNHSLRWLQSRLCLAAALSAVSAPFSYLAASRLGAVDILEPLYLYPLLSLSWAILIPSMLMFARGIHRPQIIGQPL